MQCPAYVDDHPYRPQLPVPITGYTTQPDGSQVAYFTTGSITPGGPTFRVRAEKLAGNLVQVQAQPLVDQNSTLHTLFLTELAVTAGALVLALAGGWWLVRLGLRPLEDVERTADSIAAGDLDQRVPGADQATEVGRLARALNVMLERIQAAFSARVASESRLRENEQHLRQFVADASHELRTPIAAVSAYAELFERGGSQHSEDLPRIVSGIRTETARMDRLVNDLLTLARLDEGVPMEMAPVELVSLVSDAVRTAAAVGPEWPVQFSATRPVEVNGDKDRLRQVLDNLLANIRAHTPGGDDRHGPRRSDRRPGADRGARHRAGHARLGRATRLRALLPRRPGPGPHPGRQRAGAVDRRRHRDGPRRDRLGRLDARRRAGGHRPDPGQHRRASPRPGSRRGRASLTVRLTRPSLSRRVRFTPDPQPSFTAPGDGTGTMRDMTALAPFEADVDPRRVPLDVEIVVPVYNEAAQLAERITALRKFLDDSFPFRTLITVVDNASTDDTDKVAHQLAATMRGVAAMHLPRKGRGYALRAAWSTSDAPVVAYMDVDLSTSLSALLPLVAPLLSGHRDVAIGSRLAAGAHVVRGPKRELISRAYNLLLKLTLQGRFSDAQCGFKALRRDAAMKLLPLVEDNEWFFDTELLVTAERLGLRIGEVPVDWVDDPDSRVQIVSTAADDLRGVWRMLVRRPKGLRRARSNEVAADQLLRFAGVGVVSTLGYLFLFVAWRPLLGAFAANAVAMAIATLFNTAVHRELSRTTDGQARRGRLYAVAGGLYLVSLGLTTLGLVVAQWIDPSALLAEVVALTVANVVAAVFRFAVLRAWIFRPSARTGAGQMEVSR